MAFNTQQKLAKIRKPRVNITYDVVIDGTPADKELPMVVGVLSDLCGENTPSEALKERKFVRIEPHTFDNVLAKFAPRVNFFITPKNQESYEKKPEHVAPPPAPQQDISAADQKPATEPTFAEKFATQGPIKDIEKMMSPGEVPLAQDHPPEPNTTAPPTLEEKAAMTVEIDLTFTALSDFNPDGFLQKSGVAPLFKKRKLLMDLLARLDGNDRLLQSLAEVIKAGRLQELVLPADKEKASV